MPGLKTDGVRWRRRANSLARGFAEGQAELQRHRKITSPLGRGRSEARVRDCGLLWGPSPSPDLLRKSTSPRWGEVNGACRRVLLRLLRVVRPRQDDGELGELSGFGYDVDAAAML